ncbi:MAG: hypothetical protein ABIC40_00645 [bacterium]
MSRKRKDCRIHEKERSIRKRCITINSPDYTPVRAPLDKNTNLSLKQLLKLLHSEDSVVYFYVVTSVGYQNGRLVQKGSAPNFEGGLITLCTCKHKMRTCLTSNEWPGFWIAGLSSNTLFSGTRALVFLMKVGLAFSSFEDLWFSRTLPAETKSAKLASKHKFGDLYKPKEHISGNPFDPVNYFPPIEEHVHADPQLWQNDIAYMTKEGKTPALLGGDPALSFAWDNPILQTETEKLRNHKKLALPEFLGLFRTPTK